MFLFEIENKQLNNEKETIVPHKIEVIESCVHLVTQKTKPLFIRLEM